MADCVYRDWLVSPDPSVPPAVPDGCPGWNPPFDTSVPPTGCTYAEWITYYSDWLEAGGHTHAPSGERSWAESTAQQWQTHCSSELPHTGFDLAGLALAAVLLFIATTITWRT